MQVARSSETLVPIYQKHNVSYREAAFRSTNLAKNKLTL
jgi:hypothetical protein